MITPLTLEALELGLDEIRRSPADRGVLRAIARRPDVDQRESLLEGQLDPAAGLVGDSWARRRSRRTDDGSPHPETQINVMNARVIALLAGTPDRWALAGDQLYVDLDLSEANLPPGSRLRIGEALLEVSALPHTGCQKFAARFGLDAVRFVNSPEGRALRLRGLNAQVIEPGVVRLGDMVRKA